MLEGAAAALANAMHYTSVAMCQLAVDQTSDWLMVDTWEPMQKEYQPTAVVLDHFDHEINVVRGGVETGDGTRKPVRIALLAGADLIHTMSTPGVWSEKDLDHILGKYGVCAPFLMSEQKVLIVLAVFHCRAQWHRY